MAIPDHERQLLLSLARQSITASVMGGKLTIPDIPAALCSPAASFVTLTIDDELRGCIGTLQARRPLYQDVIQNAKAAALYDSRFSPLAAADLKRIHIEISVLSAPEPLRFNDTDDLLRILEKERPGIVLQSGPYGATFLPQVWEQLPQPDDFLSHLCMKAGLPARAWKNSTERISYESYTVEKFEE
jgi:AmmeMemoRadiSam system protein A